MERNLRGLALLAAAILIGSTMTGCRSADRPAPTQIPVTTNPGTTNPATPGTGTLTVSVVDPEGRPLVGAQVIVFNLRRAWVGGERTGTNGLATIGSVPAAALVEVYHEFGDIYRNGGVDVAQQGVTLLAVTLQAARRPTVALLPVSIPAGSVSADRSELTLQVTIVGSASGPFDPTDYGDYSTGLTPALGLQLSKLENRWYSNWDCYVWLDRTHTVPSCGVPSGESPYTVSVPQFTYDPVGTVPMLASPGPVQSAMLIMDQSGRVSDLDPDARRSFAARQFIARTVTSSQPKSLSVAGFAGDGPMASTSLPEQPLWVPLAAGAVFTTDRAALDAAVGILEPFVGGSAPVFDALQAALTLTAAEAPPENRAVVALLGGGDDGDMSESARQDTLAALRRQRDATGIQFVLIAAAPSLQRREHLALAELSAALRAPAITLGVSLHSEPGFFGSYEQTWVRGSFAALDLAADLIDGLPLPTLSAVLRVKANRTGAFPPGATLHGLVFVLSEWCPWDCWELPLDFAVEIP